MNAFDLLNNDVKKLAKDRFKEPTIIQEQMIPKVLEGKNILCIAGTGLGKTESCMTPIFSKLSSKKHEPISVLYITPMKSLNRDMFDRLMWWCNKLELDISIRHGDTTQYERKLQLEYPPHILVTTPEQIQAMIIGKKFKKHLENVKYVVIDELHELVESKRGVQLTLSLERLKLICGEPQIIALSATVGSPKKAAEFIFGKENFEIVKTISAKDLQLNVEFPTPTIEDKKIAEDVFIGETVASRLRKMHEIISHYRSALIFTNTREAAEILSSRMRIFDKDFSHEVHHSSLSKDVRIKAEKEFKTEKLKTLICTSSLELGMDIGAIDVVLQYMSPRQVSKLVQRVGRSGHGVGRTSQGFIITSEGDDIFESSVIARKAKAGELEPLRIHSQSLDVLTHQIIGLLMIDYEMDPKKIFKIIKKAAPFSEMTEEEFEKLINFMEQLGLIFKDGKVIKRRKRAFEYYFENLSVIPDNVTYKVIDLASNAFVGTLDEAFVSEHSQTGSTFIVRGSPWKVISLEEGKLYVEPTNDIESSIPAWSGELIPVPYDIAMEVGKLRRIIKEMLQKNMITSEITSKIKETYPISDEASKEMISIIRKQLKESDVPDDNTVVYESYKDYVVINCCFGSLVNETLSKYLTSLLSAEYGSVILCKTDPYRIILNKVTIDDIKNIIKTHKKGDIEIVLERSLSRSTLFKSRFMRVAKRFGIIQKGASFGKINSDRLIDIYWNTPVHTETMKEIYTEKMDIEKANEMLEKLVSEKIKVIYSDKLSPIGEMGFKFEMKDAIKPARPESEIFKMFKERLLRTELSIMCMNCGKYFTTLQVKSIEDEPRCSKCGSKLIGVTRKHDRESQKVVQKRLKGETLSIEEQKIFDRVYQSANLTIVYGRKAVLVLAGRGVGPTNATRILAKPNLTEDELLKNILKVERDFVANKKFWN